jgi:DNA anti-recombination protein RmuC
MDQPVPSPPPGGDRTRRPGLFAGREQSPTPDVLDDPQRRVEQLMAAYQAALQRQLEEGLRRIQLTASGLMHEIASEVWRTAGGDKDEARSRILQELSRDQAIRSLIAHSDERFQALAVRTARFEDTLTHIAESVRATRQDLAERVGSLTAGAGDGGSPELRAQLVEVTRQVAAALGTLAERDQAIVEAVRNRVREHGELVTQETTRISAAMESYVQHGVEAVGQLAGRMDAQLEALTTRDDQISERVRAAVEEQMTLLAEQLQLMYERMAIDTSSVGETIRHHTSRGDERLRAVGEYLHVLNERVDVATRELAAQMQRTLETRVMGLAQLVRSDSEALRGELVRTASTLDERTATILDERLAAVSEAVTGETARMIDELGHRMENETAQAVRVWIDEALARLESRSEEHARRFDARTEEALTAIDRNMVRMADAIEGQLERLGRTVGDRAAGAADVAIGERFDQVLARLNDASGTVERLPLALQEGQERIEQHVETSVDRRMGALARLVRSDNETLAQQIVTSQEASRQALRSMKELQANLPSEVIEMVEQRFASLAESIESSNEMLSKRIDKMAEKIGDRYDNDIQVVVDRMGDAMHALASMGRTGAAPSPRGAEPRIELE